LFLVTLLSTACSEPHSTPDGGLLLSISSVEVSAPKKPFESSGDLWMSTWAEDDVVFVSWGDGIGPYTPPAPSPSTDAYQRTYSHHGLAKLTGALPSVTIEVVNRFMPLSDEESGHNSKPSSLLFFGGRLYVAIHTPLLEPTLGFIAYSDDGGMTFKYDLDTPWTKANGSKFVCLAIINMGKAYELNADGYVYAFGMANEVNNPEAPQRMPVYLARVRKEDILDPATWSYFAGPGARQEPVWDASEQQAVALENVSSTNLVSAMYHAGIGRYLVLTANFDFGELYEASQPWGPWRHAGTWFDGPGPTPETSWAPWFSSYMPGVIAKDAGRDSFYFAVAGRGPPGPYFGSGTPQEPNYSFQLGHLTMHTSR
jgi:hypothetical protein